MEAALRKAPPFPSRNTKKPPNASGGASVKAGAAAGKKPLPPPGISGTVASLVISPEWFAANPKETVERKRLQLKPHPVCSSRRIFLCNT